MLGRLNRLFFRGLPIYTEPAIRARTCLNPTFTMTDQKRCAVGKRDKISINAPLKCSDDSEEEFDKDNDPNSTIVNEALVSGYEHLVVENEPTEKAQVYRVRDKDLLQVIREREDLKSENAELKIERDQLAEQLAEMTRKYEEIRDAFVVQSLVIL